MLLRLALSVLVLATLSACPEDTHSPTAADTLSTSDTAPAPDSAPAPDTAPAPDAAPDAAPALDSAPAPDTAPAPDSAPDADADTPSTPDADPDIPSGPGVGVVGDGTANSCSEAAFDAQLADPTIDTIVFDCAGPATITVTSEKAIDRDLTIDGSGLVTLSGGGSTRILKLDSSFELTTPHLTVQNLTFVDGNTTALPGTDTSSGGAAIFRLGGQLTVTDCTFTGNTGPETGQDVAGGAIYSLGVGQTTISGSVFTDNACSSGGAIGNLHNQLVVSDCVITGNAATGFGGNPGNGGNGGGIYMDGVDQTFTLTDTVIHTNTANARGGGLFRVSNNGIGPMTISSCDVSGNTIPDNADSQAGGLYLQGLQIAMDGTTVSGNTANSAGGMFVWENPGTTSLDMTNCTVADNHARGSLGAGMSVNPNVVGTLLNVTLAGNSNEGATSFASALSGGQGLTLQNCLIADNAKVFTWENTSCNHTHSGGGSIQWPDTNAGGQSELECVGGILFSDPELGPLQDNGGPTPTRMPSASGPAVGIGAGCPATDQRGEPRPTTHCTAGAIEP